MSETNFSLASSDGNLAASEARAESAGQLLKAARERLGLHIAALAVSLKVSVKRIEALEADQWDSFPDAVFVRALASSVCRSLKIDPIPVLARLPKATAQSPLTDDRGINAPLMPPGFATSSSALEQLSKPVVLAGLALLAGALILIFFPNMERMEELVTSSSQAVFPPAPAGDAVSASSVDPIISKESSTPLNESTTPTELATTAAALTTSSSSPSAELTKPVFTPTETVTSGVLMVKSRGSSWVEVTDANGSVQLRKILEAGEAVDVAGALPMLVVVGRADVIEILLRGKPFDLQAVTKSNVARFEVK